VYVNSWEASDTFINISDTMDTKIAALKAHVSQMNGTDPSEMIRQWAADVAKGKEMNYAESFRVVSLVSDEDWAKTKGVVLA
jgi:LmbE family N-acetylglucosaminyl deacetylase